MKLVKINMLLLIILNSVSVSFSQNNSSGIIYYESNINGKKMSDYLNKKRKEIKDKKLIESLDLIYLNTKSIESTLIFIGNEGLFEVENKLNIDKNDLAQNINKISSGGDKKYYYNKNTKTYLIKDCSSLGECFIYDNKLFNWELTQETQQINGYICYKATRSNGRIIAWYTSSIPIGFGPKGEYGLPGLILELEVGDIIFKANKIVLNPKEAIKIEVPKGGERVTYEEYREIVNKAKKSVFGN